ncbi:MAG: aminotransferase class V-fold PLP-dependent enzyme, partial [Pseudomonadota bacterium]
MPISEATTYNVEQFPAIDRPVWLNHAAISPWPSAVIQAMRNFVEQNASQGPSDYGQWMAIEQRLRERLAILLNADSHNDIALVKNTSDGLNLIANGLDWQPGDVVICCAEDFPSNVLPWRKLNQRGVEIREVCIRDTSNHPLGDPEAPLIAALDERVRLMAVSSVRYDSGLRLDLDRLGNACRSNDTLLAVDAIQQLGAQALDVSRLPVDFVVGGSHKWLMSAEGLAMFWSRPPAREQLQPTQIGWRMWHDPFNFERNDWQPPCSARQFEPGTLNMAGIHGLDAAVGLLLEFGMLDIETNLAARVGHLLDGLSTIPGVQIITPSKLEQRAGIVSF